MENTTQTESTTQSLPEKKKMNKWLKVGLVVLAIFAFCCLCTIVGGVMLFNNPDFQQGFQEGFEEAYREELERQEQEGNISNGLDNPADLSMVNFVEFKCNSSRFTAEIMIPDFFLTGSNCSAGFAQGENQSELVTYPKGDSIHILYQSIALQNKEDVSLEEFSKNEVEVHVGKTNTVLKSDLQKINYSNGYTAVFIEYQLGDVGMYNALEGYIFNEEKEQALNVRAKANYNPENYGFLKSVLLDEVLETIEIKEYRQVVRR